jgi:type III restriction enzyme
MPRNADRQQFRNEDLVLKVSPNVDRTKWDESRYEAFIEQLCGDREYQKDAIRTALRFLLGGKYATLRELAKENFEQNPVLEERYGSWAWMEQHLQLPAKLSASLDLATATGKSYVLYGVAAILLAEGAVDRVLVLCPSTTIENGLLEKFRGLAGNSDLRDLLPVGAKISTPRIINARESITEGTICVENYHAILEHVGSSIRDGLYGKGARVAVLNDEAHHVANEPAGKVKKWKEFLADEGYGFRYVLGVSGTCYVENDYFADVIYRYSLLKAQEERYVKRVDYAIEMTEAGDPDEKWQLIRNRHEEIKRKLKARKILPLTIVVTPTIKRCQEVAEELKDFLIETDRIKSETADERVLVVYNNAPDIRRLGLVDAAGSKVEWVLAVSMLNEGWDVKRVFQIVPHEERAFNSKLLIAQVLGRGLRIPLGWEGTQPAVTVFNHVRWADSIRHLVAEVLEFEKRLSSGVLEASPFHFDLHNIDYTLQPTSVKKPMTKEYTLFAKGFVDLMADVVAKDVEVTFERAGSAERTRWETTVRHKTYTPREIALAMYERLEEAQDPEDPDPRMRTVYTDSYPVERLEKIVKVSLARREMRVATEAMKQKFLQSLGTLRRKTSENVRYTPLPTRFHAISTRQRQRDSVSAADLRRDKTIYVTDQTRDSLKEEQVEFFDEVAEPGSGYKCVLIQNRHDFKTPLSAAIADSDPEKRLITNLIKPANLAHINAWIKSAAIRFYEIDYAWKKGEHPKRGKFSPDFFIKTGDRILVVEIKDDGELRDPSEENKKKNEYAIEHFKRVNKHLEEAGSPIRYQFHFLTPRNIDTFFQCLREGRIAAFRSELDLALAPEESENSKRKSDSGG